MLNVLKETNFDLSTNNLNENYRLITDTFIKIVEHYASLKRFTRGNQSRSIIKELRMSIYTRSRLKNNFRKNPTKDNEESTKGNEIFRKVL